METCRDFQELLELFNAQGVEYVIVGGYALAHHGAPRYTRDMDLYVHPTAANAQRVMAALNAFGFGQIGLKAADFERPGQVVQLGYPPVRIDLITSIDGVTWQEAVEGSSLGRYGAVAVPFLGRQELIANKKTVGRTQDLADIERLQSPPTDKPKP
jgi:hypothetical protein